MSKKILKIIITLSFLVFLPATTVFAQFQDTPLSGNNPDSYECFDREGRLVTDGQVKKDESRGIFYCDRNNNSVYDECSDQIYDQGDNCDPRAQLKPPTLQQLEIWFLRIVYSIWAISATFSFLGIVYLGYQYMISRGAPEAMTKVKDRIVKFLIGLALVFLAVPILNTIFRLLAVNDSVECYAGLTNAANNVGIGFQFFFPELCTDPTGSVGTSDPCSVADAAGLVCNTEGARSNSCNVGRGVCVFYRCRNNVWVLESSGQCISQ